MRIICKYMSKEEFKLFQHLIYSVMIYTQMFISQSLSLNIYLLSHSEFQYSQYLFPMHHLQEYPECSDNASQLAHQVIPLLKENMDMIYHSQCQLSREKQLLNTANMLQDAEDHSAFHNILAEQGSALSKINSINPFQYLINESQHSLQLEEAQKILLEQDRSLKKEISKDENNCYEQIVSWKAQQASVLEKKRAKPKPNINRAKYKKETRQEKVKRYLQKKQKRIWVKKISYQCRKKVADKRIRANGRFVKKNEQNRNPRTQKKQAFAKIKQKLDISVEQDSSISFHNITQIQSTKKLRKSIGSNKSKAAYRDNQVSK